MPSYESSMRRNKERIAKDVALLDSVDPSSTMDLHKSNLMRLQVKELLEECQLDLKERKWAADAHEYLQTLTKLVSQCRIKQGYEDEAIIKDRADRVSHVVIDESTVLSVEPIGCTRSNLAWTKKSGNAQVLPTFTLMVTLPSKLFLSKDFLNYRYFDKRNHIMNIVAKHLAKHSKKVGNVEYSWSKGANRSPYIQLIPKLSSSKSGAPKFHVELHFGMESIDWIPQLRLVPNRCNIKGPTNVTSSDDADHLNYSKSVQSQLYNHSLLFDVRNRYEDPYLACLVDYPNVEATLVLIQVWALQRGLWRNHDGWSKENAAIFLLYLLRTNRMNPRMTPIQQFTVVMHSLSNTNWSGRAMQHASETHSQQETTLRASQSQGTQFSEHEAKRQRRDVLVLPLEDKTEKETIRLSSMSRLYEKQTKESPLTNEDPPTIIDLYASTKHYSLGPVLLDPTLTYNYLGDVSPNYMNLLQFHAQKSLRALKESRSSFSYLFMRTARFWSQWDIFIRIPIKRESVERAIEWEHSIRSLVSQLELGLGNRIHALRVLSTGNGDMILTNDNQDQLYCQTISINSTLKLPRHLSPTGTSEIILGFAINPGTSQRVVDRGPPSDQHKQVKSFVELWGNKAQLRRFKDGAIVQAVVWNDSDDCENQYQNEVKLQGGYVTRISRHIIRLHYTKEEIDVALPNLSSVVDGMATKETTISSLVDPVSAHQNIMKAFESLSTFLRTPPKSFGLPLAIDAVEPLSPCLRYSELFPPLPHPFLGGKSPTGKKVAGAIVSDPILIQIRFGGSSKWPSDLKAIGAAKTAMLIQLANGFESLNDRDFGDPTLVTPTYLDVGYRGYHFRILVRADPEINLLRGLVRPSTVASALLQELTRGHVVAAKHHSLIHAVHTLHPSSAAVVRMAKRWVANHLLSGFISTEAIDLLVAKVYSDGESPLEAPSTIVAGFLRFLHLLAYHDWSGEPMIVNPRGHIEDEEYDKIHQQFDTARGENRDSGPPMYIVAPYDKQEVDDESTNNRNAVNVSKAILWVPSTISPEWVVVSRATALAKRSYQFMMKRVCSFDKSSDWSAIFHESPSSFQSYSVLLRVGTDFVIDPESSSTGNNLDPSKAKESDSDRIGQLETSFTRSMRFRRDGPKGLQRKVYRNLQVGSEGGGAGENGNPVLLSFQPVTSLMALLRARFGRYALFFYNELSPEVIGIVWRPQTYNSMPFSAMTSEYARPKDECSSSWKNDSLVVRNATDLLREMSEYYQDIVTNVKIVDESYLTSSSKRRKLDASKKKNNVGDGDDGGRKTTEDSDDSEVDSSVSEH